MARFRRNRGGGGGGGGGSNTWGGTIMIVFGSVALLVCLIMYGIAIGQLDTAYTSAATYIWMTGLSSIMGVFGMVVFLAFMALGLGSVGAGAFMNIRKAQGGSWSDILMLAVMGGISLVITLIMLGVNLTQLNTAMTTTNATTNYARFVGLGSTMSVFGIIIFVTMIGSCLAQFTFAGIGAYKKIRG